MKELPTVKCVIVGNGGVGKTTLYITYTTGKYPEDYIPIVFDNYSQELIVDGQEILLNLWEVYCIGEGSERLRPLWYPKTDVFLLAFAIDNRASFNDIDLVWVPEVRKYEPKAPIILLGTKIDLRESEENQRNWITTKMGQAYAKSVNLEGYMECSSLTMKNIDAVFCEAAVLGSTRWKMRRRESRCILL